MCPEVSVADLSPEYFRGPQPRWVSCYAFFKGWLLLSLPPHCLWLRTPFYLTLSQHLGTLASVWVASLSVWDLTPQCPSPGIYGADRFGVREEGEPFRVLVFQSVLYPVGYLARDYAATYFGGK